MSIVVETCTNVCGSKQSGCTMIECVDESVKLNSTEKIDHIVLHSIGKQQNGCLDSSSLPPSTDVLANGSIIMTETCDETNMKQVLRNKMESSSTDVKTESNLSNTFDCNHQQSIEVNGLCVKSENMKCGSIKKELSPNFPDTATEEVSCQMSSSNRAEEPFLKISSIVSCAEEPSKKNLAVASKQIESANDKNDVSMQPPALEHRQSSRLSSSSRSNSIKPSASMLPCNLTLSSPSPMLVLPDGRSLLISRSNENQPANRELIRPVAKLLQDTGLLLASEQVFKNLVKIQRKKVKHNKSTAVTDHRLLEKLKSSHSTLASRNVDFAIESLKHCYCGFHSESSNVLCLHQLCGELGKCCMCDGKFAYRNRVQFERHVDVVHKQTAHRIVRPAAYSCDLCPTDLGSQSLMKLHEKVCKKQFVSTKNLSPHVNHEDIPLKPRVLQKPGVPSNSDIRIVVNLPDKKLPSSSIIFPTKVPSNSSGGFVLRPQFKQTVNIPAVSKSNAVNLSMKKSNIQTSPAVYSGSSKRSSNTEDRLSNLKTEVQFPAVSKVVTSSGGKMKKANGGCVICPACSGFVRDEAALEIHMRVVHSLLSSIEMTVCWMCHDRSPVATHELLSHLADRHCVTLATMLQLRQCSFCSTVPKMRNATAFEVHMLAAHSTLFLSPEHLWQIIEELTPRSNHIYPEPDGTLKCQLCNSSFISRAFLCRHAFMAHGGSACDCNVCMRATAGVTFPQQPDTDTAVVISDEEDNISTRKKLKLNGDEESTALRIEQVRSVKREGRFQDFILQDGSLMDKVEEILEIDGETVLIVQEADYDVDEDS